MNCPICGQPTFLVYGKYPRKDGLCKDCSQRLFNGEIEQCPDCGNWMNANEVCACKKKAKEPEQIYPEITCLLCGEPSNGKHFCYDCYLKYKGHSFDIRITNCRDVEMLDQYGNKNIYAENGIAVRSQSEARILDYLFNHNIKVIYERTIPYKKENGEEAKLKPDFYLPDYDLYIEYNGYTGERYGKKVEYVQKIYKQEGYIVEFLSPEDIKKIDETFNALFHKYIKK